MVKAWIGTSGWVYDHWQQFYENQTPSLQLYAKQFQTVEINNSFYRLPSPENFKAWRDQTPSDFLFAVKMSRYFTHQKKLNDPKEPVGRFMKSAKELGDKLGPVLLQLPPNLGFPDGEADKLTAALEEFPKGVKLALEPRNKAWFTDVVYEILRKHNTALVLTDRNGVQGPVEATADWTYIRFHSGKGKPEGCYTRNALEDWVKRLDQFKGVSVYAYFNNDGHDCAPRDAAVFANLLSADGRTVSRAPATPVQL